MNKEDKKLLLTDLCARLPYGVKVTWDNKHSLTVTPHIYCAIASENKTANLPKLLLRQMPSMTEEEKKEYHKTKIRVAIQWDAYDNPIGFELISTFKTFDWLNAHYFDYRGLIKKGLAIEAPVDMYKID